VVLRHRSKFYILPFASTSYSSCIHVQYCRQKKWLNFTNTREKRLKHYVTSHRDASEKLSHEHGEQRPFHETLSTYGGITPWHQNRIHKSPPPVPILSQLNHSTQQLIQSP
jgi:hypothetical protein